MIYAKNTEERENILMNLLNEKRNFPSKFERQLCNVQGKMFELSAKKNLSSLEFIDSYMKSKTASFFDLPFDRTQWLGEENLLLDVLEEIPDLPKGKTFDIDSLFWMGYLYRYWHFLTGQTSHEIVKNCNAQLLHSLYPAYHTLDCGQAIDRILESAKEKSRKSDFQLTL